MKAKYFLVFFCLFSILGVQSQRLKFEHYNDGNGLSHNSVRHIVQDEKGFLWLGTFSGLNRFDGYQFKSYTSSSKTESINSDDITVLELDEDSNKLWIGTRNGLTRLQLDTHDFKTYLPEENNPNSIGDREIRGVHVDSFGKVWVGTRDKGVFIFHPEEERFEKVTIEGFEYVRNFTEDSNGNIWLSTFREGIAKIRLDEKGEILEIIRYDLLIPNSKDKNPYVNFIYEDGKSDIFVGTREGLYKFNKELNQFENLYIKDDAIRNSLGPYFLSIAQASDDKYWIGTLGGLVVCNQLEDVADGDFELHNSVITEDTSLIDNVVYALHFDESGVLWIGTEDGLDKYDPFENQFRISNTISGHINNLAPKIRGFCKTYDSKVIVATRHNGLFISKDDGFVPLFNGQNDIASIYSEDGKIFYCGLWNGQLLVYNYLQNSSKLVDTGIENESILSVEKYDEDKIIIGSYGKGVVILNKETFEVVIPSGRIIPDYQVTKIINTGAGILWISSQKGMVKYDIDSGKDVGYNEDNGLPHNNVSDVLIDSKNTVWAATRKGLATYNPLEDRFESVSELEDLQGKWVTHMVHGNENVLWFNLNNNKIAKYNIKRKRVKIYHVKSGNRLDIFSSGGFYNFNNARIFLGGKNGVIYFSPNEIKENTWSPSPVISEFKIQNKEIYPGMEINGQTPLAFGLNYDNEVALNYENRNFSIQFSSPSFSNERLNKFRYMLQGFDEDWIETTSDARTIQYSNLAPSDYVFKVKSRNSDGVWSDITSYTIKISPPFLLTIPGLALSFVVISLVIYYLRRQIKFRINLKKALLKEKIKRDRDEKLNNEKLRFFTNISHELRTPLTLILGPVKQLLQTSKIESYDRSRVHLINQNANRLLRLVNQILDFRRAETGELKLKVVKTDVLINTKNIFASFTELAESKDINLNLTLENEAIDCWIDIDKYNKILYNLLSNAMKFTNNYGNVDLFLGIEEGDKRTLVIEVSDDGIGIPEGSVEKIFERFYQAKNSTNITTGTGIGLSLVKALVEIHKGEISVDSTAKLGSVFTVRLPVSKNSFNKNELFEFTTKAIVEEEEIKVRKVKSNLDIKHKILVIEDNIELRKYLVDFLSDYYKVYQAENGKEGLEVCKRVKPILCVVDVMMPEMDGFEFVQTLKDDENLSHTAIILLTALAENENRIKGYRIGVDGYLVKPFDPFLLKTRIENILKIHTDLKQKFSGDVDGDMESLAHSQIDVDFITGIKESIEENLNNPELTAKYLCDEMAMSSSKLYRRIKQLTDLSPNEFIRTVRLKKSVQLLKTKKHNVSEVANMVGFNDPLYFSKCFKTQFGDPPSKYIK